MLLQSRTWHNQQQNQAAREGPSGSYSTLAKQLLLISVIQPAQERVNNAQK
jgi:hypothetical protein